MCKHHHQHPHECMARPSTYLFLDLGPIVPTLRISEKVDSLFSMYLIKWRSSKITSLDETEWHSNTCCVKANNTNCVKAPCNCRAHLCRTQKWPICNPKIIFPETQDLTQLDILMICQYGSKEGIMLLKGKSLVFDTHLGFHKFKHYLLILQLSKFRTFYLCPRPQIMILAIRWTLVSCIFLRDTRNGVSVWEAPRKSWVSLKIFETLYLLV